MRPSLRSACWLVAALAASPWLARPAEAIIVRHDRDPAEALELAARFPFVCVAGGGSGTLIAPRWVLTAAHVVENFEPSDFRVRCGASRAAVARSFVLPGEDELPWDRRTDDLALLYLADALTDPAPAALYRGGDELGEMRELGKTGWLVGAGYFGRAGEPFAEPDGRVRAAANRISHLEEKWLLTVFSRPPGGTDLEGLSAAGDSGGPLLVETDEGPLVVGVSSYSEYIDAEFGEETYGATDFYVRVAAYADWIDGVIAAVERGEPVASEGPGPGGEAPQAQSAEPPTMGSVLAAAAPGDWRPLDPASTLYLELPNGRVVIRLAPEFAPAHVANLQALVAERYFDGLAVVRSQENYVVQWGDPRAEEQGAREIRRARRALPPEFDRALGDDLAVTPLPDGDVYAPETGFVDGFPVALDRERGRVWLAHCHGMVGAGRAESADSGSGAELYAVIGHSPRHLDRNVTLVGRVVQGIELLSTLPRGTGGLGFYEDPAEHVEIRSLRLGSELPPEERDPLEILRTDTETFRRLIAARRHRRESWFVHPTGRVSLCNVPLPVRETATGGAG